MHELFTESETDPLDKRNLHLSKDDCKPTRPVPSANAWAYWVGTSFAAPIISAIAARVLEAKLRGSLDPDVNVQQAIINSAATRPTNWTRLEHNFSSASGPVVLAKQECQTTEIEVEVDDIETEVVVEMDDI